MKKLMIIISVVSLAVVYCVSAEAAVTDRTASIKALGSVGPITSLSITPAMSPGLTFGTTNADAFPTVPDDKKIVISYTSNYSPWKMMVYTNNAQVNDYNPTTEKGRYAKGGLVLGTGDNVQVVPCKWVAKDGANTAIPALPTPANMHNFIKDKRDQDDPATVTNPDGTLAKEDWASAFAVGYANIAFGDATGGFCVDPTNTTPSDPKNKYKGDAVSGSIAVYIAGLFGTGGATSAGDYSSSIYFDLYHE